MGESVCLSRGGRWVWQGQPVGCLAQPPPGAPRSHPSCRLPTRCQQGRHTSWCKVTLASSAPHGLGSALVLISGRSCVLKLRQLSPCAAVPAPELAADNFQCYHFYGKRNNEKNFTKVNVSRFSCSSLAGPSHCLGAMAPLSICLRFISSPMSSSVFCTTQSEA